MINCIYFLESQNSTLDIFVKIATIVIATVNVILMFYVFKINYNKNDENKRKDRRISLMKSIILDHNLKYLYEIFDNIEQVLDNIKSNGISDDEKKSIIEKSDDLFIKLRRKFIDTLLAIDETLYSNILEKSDDLQRIINENSFDNGINLSHIPMYDEKILNPITEAKTEILKKLFNYEG